MRPVICHTLRITHHSSLDFYIMPIYEYKCAKCESRFEKMQKVGDEPPEVCAHCGGKLEKQWSLSGFQFKGAGWYVTDYSNKGKAEAKAENKSESESGAKSETKSETSAGGEKSSAGESTAQPKTASNSAQSDNSTVKKSE